MEFTRSASILEQTRDFIRKMKEDPDERMKTMKKFILQGRRDRQYVSENESDYDSEEEEEDDDEEEEEEEEEFNYDSIEDEEERKLILNIDIAMDIYKRGLYSFEDLLWRLKGYINNYKNQDQVPCVPSTTTIKEEEDTTIKSSRIFDAFVIGGGLTILYFTLKAMSK